MTNQTWRNDLTNIDQQVINFEQKFQEQVIYEIHHHYRAKKST